MWSFLLLSACDDDPHPRPGCADCTTPATTAPTQGGYLVTPVPLAAAWEEAAPAPAAPWSCAVPRDPDYADWPGGLRLELTAEPFALGTPAEVAVTGAAPGERVVLHLGDACTFDCPPERDGACFQAAGAAQIGEGVADESGEIRFEVTPDASWDARWLVLQAAAPDARALSRPLVDHLSPSATPFGAPDSVRELAPMTLRGITEASNVRHRFTWPVEAGRGSVVTFTWTALPDDVELVWSTPTSTLEANDAATYSQASAADSRWFVEVDQGSAPFSLDLRLEPRVGTVWRADADGDGYADPEASPTVSADPIPGASSTSTDCDDADPDRSPAAPEVCGDGIDQDCDGYDRACGLDAPGSVRGTRISGEPYAGLGGWIASGDLDGDGAADLIAGADAGAVIAWDLAGRSDRRSPVALVATGAAVGDLDGDGAQDVAAAIAGQVQIVAGPLAPGAPWAPIRTLEDDLYAAGDLVTGQLDADPADELLVWNLGSVFAFTDPLGSGEPALGVSGGFAPPAIADMDGDGIGEVLTSEGCRFPTLSPADYDCLSDYVHGFVGGADVDGDGRDDAILGAGSVTQVLTAPWAHGEYGYRGAWLVVVGFGPAGSGAVYPDPLGNQRLVISDSIATYVAPVDGPGTLYLYSTTVLTSSGGGPHALAVDDWDGDGSEDLAIGFASADLREDLDSGAVYVLWGP